MAKPFVSYDGADERGVRAEVWVQTGTGTITKIENQDDESKLNVMVLIRSDHSSVKRPIKGWLSKKDPVHEAVTAAAASGREVEYRVESQRKQGVDRSTPITDLRVDTETAGANTISILAGIDGVASSEAVTDPAEDPHTGGRIPAAREGAATLVPVGGPPVEQALTALSTARRTGLSEGVVDAAVALALAAGASAKQVQEAGFTGQGRSDRPAARRAHAQEAAPHIRFNSDHRVNLGSYAVQAAFSAEKVAYDVLAAVEQQEYDAHNAAVASGEASGDPMVAPVPVDLAQAVGLARVLLGLADRVQVGAYGGGHPDRMANSHTRARYLVFDAVRTRHPVPLRGDAAARQGWVDAVVSEGVDRFRTLAVVSQQVEEPSGTTDDRDPQPPVEQHTEGQPAEEQLAEGRATEGRAEGPLAAEVVAVAAAIRRAAAEAAAAPAGAAEAAEPAAEDVQGPDAPAHDPRAQAATRRSPAPRPPAKGQEGFAAPSPEVVARFGALAKRAGFTPSPDSPVVGYLTGKLGASRARDVHGPALESLVTWYEQRPDGVAAFRGHVLALSTATEHRASA